MISFMFLKLRLLCFWYCFFCEIRKILKLLPSQLLPYLIRKTFEFQNVMFRSKIVSLAYVLFHIYLCGKILNIKTINSSWWNIHIHLWYHYMAHDSATYFMVARFVIDHIGYILIISKIRHFLDLVFFEGEKYWNKPSKVAPESDNLTGQPIVYICIRYFLD